jgi:hypothetical protein
MYERDHSSLYDRFILHAAAIAAAMIVPQLESGVCHQCQELLSHVLQLHLVAVEMRIVPVYELALLLMLGMTEHCCYYYNNS